MKRFTCFVTLFCLFSFAAFAQNSASAAAITLAAVQAPAGSVVYSNPLTLISFPLPEGFKLSTAADTSVFIMGPTVQGRMMSIHMNLTPVPQGVKEEQMYQMNLDSFKKNTAQYANIQEYIVPKGKAFVAEEVAKTDTGEIHRRFLMIWVNGYQTNLIVAGSYASLAEKKEMVDAFFKSVMVPTS